MFKTERDKTNVNFKSGQNKFQKLHSISHQKLVFDFQQFFENMFITFFIVPDIFWGQIRFVGLQRLTVPGRG